MTVEDLIRNHEIDCVKTFVAMKAGYRVVRIDYTQLNKMSIHVKTALEQKQDLYLSTPTCMIISQISIISTIIWKIW